MKSSEEAASGLSIMKGKGVLSLLLAAVLILGMLVPALAEDIPAETDVPEEMAGELPTEEAGADEDALHSEEEANAEEIPADTNDAEMEGTEPLPAVLAEETDGSPATDETDSREQSPEEEDILVFASGAPAFGSAPCIVRTGLRAVTLSWDAVASADYYEVFIKEGETWRRKNKTAETSVSYSSLVLEQAYAYKVRAHILSEEKGSLTAFSDELPVQLDGLSTALTSQIVSRKAVSLSWDAVPACDYYEIYRQTDETGSWSRQKIVYGDTTVCLPLKAGTAYRYRIRAHVNPDGQGFFGVYSEPVSAGYTVPALEGLSSTVQGFTALNLSWFAVPGADYYEVYRKLGEEGAWTRNRITSEPFTAYELRRNQRYAFKVRAHISLPDDAFFTAYSEPVAVDTAIPALGAVTITNPRPQKYLLSWDEAEDAVCYEVFRLTAKDTDWRRNVVLEGAAQLTYTVSRGAFCGYKVRARMEREGERACTAFSEPVYIWNVGAPEAAIVEISAERMLLSWAAVAQADSYAIYADEIKIDETTALRFAVDSSYSGSAISVSAVLRCGDTEIETARSEAIRYEAPAAVRYRALLIGETAYAARLNGPENDLAFMNTMLNGVSEEYTVIAQRDAALDELLELIDIAFAGTSETDVSLFYYSGHGVTGSTAYYSGALQTVDYKYLTTLELAELLSAVPGRVLVILDSCGSGAAISDDALRMASPAAGGTEALAFDAEQFNNGVIRAFSLYDSVIGKAEGLNPDSPSRSGELRQTKFSVLTGSAYEEKSQTTQINGVWGSVLTRGIAYAVGCSYPAGAYTGSMPADANADDGLSFSELAACCAEYAGDGQHVLSYTARPDYVFFRR